MALWADVPVSHFPSIPSILGPRPLAGRETTPANGGSSSSVNFNTLRRVHLRAVPWLRINGTAPPFAPLPRTRSNKTRWGGWTLARMAGVGGPYRAGRAGQADRRP